MFKKDKIKEFAIGEHYHIYNRGVDKRDVYMSKNDYERFLQCMIEFNVVEPIGSIYENSFIKNNKKSSKNQLGRPTSKLVDIVCYCLNSNHYHFILRQVADNGISEFMKRLGGGYTKYFNNKYKRSGSLFQGGFKHIHIDSNEYLLHLSAYVNLNFKVHQLVPLGRPTSKLVMSSWNQYIGEDFNNESNVVCEKDIILGQFGNINEYKKFAESSLLDILENKEKRKEIEFT